MPVYSYVCQRCSRDEKRVAGVDDHLVKCAFCGQPMRRTTGMSAILARYRDQDPVRRG